MSSKRIKVVFPSAARTATPTAVDLEVGRFAGILLIIDATAITATPSVVFNIKGVDRVTGKEWLILASAAVTAVSTTVLEVYPGTDEAANLSENAYLPNDIQIEAVHGDADSITYQVVAHLLP